MESCDNLPIIDISFAYGDAINGRVISGPVLSFAGLKGFYIQGRSLITSEGEAIEGEALEEVEVFGRVSFFINRALGDDESPL